MVKCGFTWTRKECKRSKVKVNYFCLFFVVKLLIIINLRNYPTLIELADELTKILDCFHLDRVVCLGDGAGADISATFAIMHPNRCLGLCLIRPNGNIASLNEQLSYLSNGLNDKINKAEAVFAYIVWQRFGLKVNENSID